MSVVAVLGAGSWGTALALQLARNGQSVKLWGHRAEHQSALIADGENRRYLPGVSFPDSLMPVLDLVEAVEQADAVLVVTPSHAYGHTLELIKSMIGPQTPVMWACKGLEQGSGRFLHEVTDEILGATHPSAIVSGPSFAKEVAVGLPTAITVASSNAETCNEVAALLHGNSFRVYTSADVVGVEIGGAVKNVMAIATGISDGLGFGANARSALITRGLAEMVRLGVAVGGEKDTFMGLAGLGDLLLTATDDQSRNRRFGLAIGRGMTETEARESIGQVVEGPKTAREVMRLAGRHNIEMPITEQVDLVLNQGLSPKEAVNNLLNREAKPEGI